MTTKFSARELREKDRRISEWDAGQLSRFCEVGYEMALRQFEARLNMVLGAESSPKEGLKGELLKGLMAELEIVAENLIILALDYRFLDAKNLKKKDVEQKPKGRSLILTEREERT